MSQKKCQRAACTNLLPPYGGRGRPRRYCSRECASLARQASFFSRLAAAGVPDTHYWAIKQFASRRMEEAPYDDGSSAYVMSLTDEEHELLRGNYGTDGSASLSKPLDDRHDLVVREPNDDDPPQTISLQGLNEEEHIELSALPALFSPSFEAAAQLKAFLAYFRLASALRRALAEEPTYQEIVHDVSASEDDQNLVVFSPISVEDNGDVIVRFPIGPRTLAAVHFKKDTWEQLTQREKR